MAAPGAEGRRRGPDAVSGEEAPQMGDSIRVYGGLIGLAGVAFLAIGCFIVFSDILRKNPWSVVLVLSAVMWIVGESMGLLDPGPGRARAWMDLKYVGLSFAGPSWLGLALRFSGASRWIGPGTTLALAGSGGAFAAAVLAEPLHGLLGVRGPAEGGGRILDAGPLWYLLIAFLFFCLARGLALMLRSIARSPLIMRRRAAVIGTAVLLPTLCGVLDILPSAWAPPFPMAPFAVGLSALVIAYGLVGLRMAIPIRLARAAARRPSTWWPSPSSSRTSPCASYRPTTRRDPSPPGLPCRGPGSTRSSPGSRPS
jgi:hypothetical protein